MKLCLLVFVLLLSTAHPAQESGIRAMADPFVLAAPLVVAMSCSDGIAMVAAHPIDEPLLYTDEENNNNNIRPTSRIQKAGDAAVMSCGWRADGNSLLEKARELVQDDEERFGEQSGHLPTQLSEFMAVWAVSGMRSLSCASIVALHETLWLVDSTGAYPVVAQCLGGGTRQNNGDGVKLVSEYVHEALLKLKQSSKSRKNVFDMTAEEGLTRLVSILSKDRLVEPEAKLELAILDHSRTFIRK